MKQVEGLPEKFRQNPQLKAQLLATGDAVLAECIYGDKIWAIVLECRTKTVWI